MNMKEKIESLKEEAKRLEEILAVYPDLGEEKDRWEHIRLHSSFVNSKCTNYDMHHTCGCCDDAPLLVLPYLLFNGTKIYSKPVEFSVAKKDQYNLCNIAYLNWDKELKEAGIPDTLIKKIDDYLKKETIKAEQREQDMEQQRNNRVGWEKENGEDHFD